MQILYVYQQYINTMIEFDYLQYPLVHLLEDRTLQVDSVPVILREPKYQVKKPRSSYANNPHI